MLHTSLGGSPAHDLYAPCAPAELHGTDFDHWALGHIHQRFVDVGRATIVMPGNPQGRDINEAGPKSATLVTISDDRKIRVEERLTSVAEFQRLGVDLGGVEDWREGLARIEKGLAAARAAAPSEHLVARLKLTGVTPLAWRLRSDADKLEEDARLIAAELGRTWIDKIELNCAAPRANDSAPSSDPIAELRGLMETEVAQSMAFQDALRDLAAEMRSHLPRGFARRPARPGRGRVCKHPSPHRSRGRRGCARTSARGRSGPRRVRIGRLDLSSLR